MIKWDILSHKASGSSQLCKLARDCQTTYHKLHSFNHRNFLSQFWGQKSKCKVSAGLVPSKDYKGKVWSRPSSWLVDDSPMSLHIIFLRCMSGSMLPSLKSTPVLLGRAHPPCLVVTVISVKTLCPNKVSFWNTGFYVFNVWTWGGHNSTCNTYHT